MRPPSKRQNSDGDRLRQRCESAQPTLSVRCPQACATMAAAPAIPPIYRIQFKRLRMSGSFDDRRKGFESKWAHDADMQFRIMNRRNKLLGQWAAGELGLSGD